MRGLRLYWRWWDCPGGRAPQWNGLRLKMHRPSPWLRGPPERRGGGVAPARGSANAAPPRQQD
jgi:hypothetical protein